MGLHVVLGLQRCDRFLQLCIGLCERLCGGPARTAGDLRARRAVDSSPGLGQKRLGFRNRPLDAKGDADVPWSLQWARRSHLFSFENLTVWGLGLPLGIWAWAGFLLMGWRILKGEWRHALLWGWTAFYFIWQSL